MPTVIYAHTFDLKNFTQYSIGFGTWQEFYKETQTTESGAVNGFEFRPYFTANIDYSLNSFHKISPQIGYVTRRSYSDSSTTTDQFFMKFDYAYKALEWLQLKGGTSFIWRSISGDGSEEELPNGDTTETYYSPSERKNVFNQTLDFGVEILHENMSFKFDNYIYSVNDEEQRLISNSLSLNYLIPLEGL